MGATLQGLGVIEVKDYSGWQFGTFVGYANNIMRVLKTIKGFGEAEYTDKKEVARVLREAVRNGENPGEPCGRRTKPELGLPSTGDKLVSSLL